MLLAIDSATRVLSIALYDGQQVYAESTWNTSNRHTVELTPAIQHLLAQSHLTVADLSALAVSQGPGSFNGLRIGFSVAKGLAVARKLPLVAIPTLDIVAAAQLPFDGVLIAVLQAGRGRVCAGTYDWNGTVWIGRGDLRIVAWDAVLVDIAGTAVICGEIDADGRAMIERSNKPLHITPPAYRLRRAGFLAELAWARWQRGQTDDLAAVTPLYLHQPGVPHP
ncbi:MAG: tRNA (adenosine(37)-N6)-threonylcarbamoyltransferase complex dimerization subunit type 1 TsaB [Anaerolineae bacterium]|nr:tRNA (adenosine(37)-N6)-threonylcarbamoyltransferase complex dimerization subunit type 1 TsaB [Anaerolineae bacterium]